MQSFCSRLLRKFTEVCHPVVCLVTLQNSFVQSYVILKVDVSSD